MKKIPFLLFALLTLIYCKTYEINSAQNRFVLNDIGTEKDYLIEYINKKKKENLIGSLPTLIINRIDGELIIRSDVKSVDKINLSRKEIKRIEVIPIDKSVQLFGSAGKDGVIQIFTY